MGKSTVCVILRGTCEVLWKVLGGEYVKAPSTVAEWEGVSKDFSEMEFSKLHWYGLVRFGCDHYSQT